MKKAFKSIAVIAAIVLLLPGLALAGKDEIMFPDVWGIELPIPEHFGGECYVSDIYYTKDNDIYIHYGKVTSEPFDQTVVIEKLVYSFSQKKSIKKWIFKKPNNVFGRFKDKNIFTEIHIKQKIIEVKQIRNPKFRVEYCTTSNVIVNFKFVHPGFCNEAVYESVIIKRKNAVCPQKKCMVYIAPAKINARLRENCRYPPDLSDAKIHTSTPHLENLFALNDGTVLLTFFDCPYVIRFDKNFESPFFDDNPNWFLVNTNKALQIQKMAYEKAYKHHMATREGSLPELMDEIITDYFINNMSGGKDVEIR